MADESITVLMAVYLADRAAWVDQALASLAEQTVPAAEIIIVEDGPIPAEVDAVLTARAAQLPITRLAIAENIGLSGALQAGLEICRTELVARADSDDVNEPERFALQLAALTARPDLSVLSGYVSEFTDDSRAPYAVRTVPIGAAAVARAARWRSPVNHPAVMFRRSHVLAVGGYNGFVGIEDYFLWAKLLAAGRHIDNLPEVLVRMRAGAAQGRRRGGLGYARTEVRLFREFVRIGFLTRPQAVAGLLVRLPVRLVPDRVRSLLYRHVLRRS
jgi:glycosyltransferase involved in cell wall biosynthesis